LAGENAVLGINRLLIEFGSTFFGTYWQIVEVCRAVTRDSSRKHRVVCAGACRGGSRNTCNGNHCAYRNLAQNKSPDFHDLTPPRNSPEGALFHLSSGSRRVFLLKVSGWQS
jgi:hypothetical protein